MLASRSSAPAVLRSSSGASSSAPIFLLHGTLFINSLAHLIGNRRFQTTDESRNSLILALITLGEGWHNNHHRYQGTVRQGFYWWEIDITWYGLKMLSWLGLIWNLRPVPLALYDEATAGRRTPHAGVLPPLPAPPVELEDPAIVAADAA